MRTEAHPPVPALIAREGTAWATTKDVATYFEKEHKHVLRDVDALKSHGPDLDHGWFREVRAPHPTIPGRLDRTFEMTRDGFSLLVMGWTGPKALAFKVRYIAAFNAMEAELRSRVAPQHAIPQTLPEALRLAAGALEAKALSDQRAREETERADVAETKVAELMPFANVGMLAAASGHDLMTVLRGMPYLNTKRALGALVDLGILRRAPKGKVRVNRSRYGEHFLEGVPDSYGGVVITPTDKGRILLGRLFREGRLPMLKGHKPQRMLKAIGAT